MKNKRSIQIAGFGAISILFVFALKTIFLLEKLSNSSAEELKTIYPRLHEFVFVLAQKATFIFALWFILLLGINGFFIYLLSKHSKKAAEIIITITVLILMFSGAEYTLRWMGYKPGTHTIVRYFTPVDSLYLKNGFATDSLGITKIDLEDRKIIADNISNENENYDTIRCVHEAYSLVRESIKLKNGKVNNEFASTFKTLTQKNTSTLSEFEKAIIDYVNCPVNELGFRSIAFKQYESNKPRVLLIGDSFTWGHSASDIYNSFADELLAKGYVVYNSGISCADAAQYLAVAKQYIAVLKPDIVIVNFYLANDITYYKREVKPYMPIFFSTNAGNLIACPFGEYFKTPEQAYNYYFNKWQIPQNENLFNRVMAQTVITSLAWRILSKMNIVNYGSSEVGKYMSEAEKRKYVKPYCNTELKEIKEFTEQNGARFILSSIPEVYRFTFNTKKDFPDVFEGLDYVEMKVTREDYKLDDGHFNDRGHKRYADFLIKQIEAHD